MAVCVVKLQAAFVVCLSVMRDEGGKGSTLLSALAYAVV